MTDRQGPETHESMGRKKGARSVLRNRIVEHVRVKASELIPHELNPRRHGNLQKQALEALWREIGFARSLLGYRDAQGKIRLIDGHLRRDLLKGDLVDVEILDVNEEEARKLLLSIDPLAALAQNDDAVLRELMEQVQTEEDAIEKLWSTIGNEDFEEPNAEEKDLADDSGPEILKDNWMILVECADELEQTERLQELHSRGWKCKALTS